MFSKWSSQKSPLQLDLVKKKLNRLKPLQPQWIIGIELWHMWHWPFSHGFLFLEARNFLLTFLLNLAEDKLAFKNYNWQLLTCWDSGLVRISWVGVLICCVIHNYGSSACLSSPLYIVTWSDYTHPRTQVVWLEFQPFCLIVSISSLFLCQCPL